MMFKAIYMHTKPLKHTKNMQILTNYIKKHDFCKFLTKVSKWKKFSKTPILIFCMHLRMDVSFKNTKPLKNMCFDCFCYFYLPPFCYFMIFSYKKEIAKWSGRHPLILICSYIFTAAKPRPRNRALVVVTDRARK